MNVQIRLQVLEYKYKLNSEEKILLIAGIVNLLFEIYGWFLIVRIFLTWIPSIDWYKEPFKTMALLADVFLNPFRKIIPPVSGLDLSPIVALLFLRFAQISIVKVLVYFNL